MRVRLKANGASRTAEIAYYAYEDATFLTEWQGAVGEDRNPLRRDAVEFAENAWGRWKAYQDRDNYATGLDDMAVYINDNPRAGGNSGDA